MLDGNVYMLSENQKTSSKYYNQAVNPLLTPTIREMSVLTDRKNGELLLDIEVEDGLNLNSTDQAFSKLSMPQIQKLSKEYRSNAQNAKKELHNLVCDKYRDLIKIAEDIGDMYHTSKIVDESLSNLSYKKSAFVQFDRNSYSKFNSEVRIQNANRARQNEKSTILNSIIHDELIKFDFMIINLPTPISNTSNLLHYSKLYYTIEYLFEDILNSDSYLRLKFQDLKANFIRYLEFEISCYNISTTSYSNQSDKFKVKQRLGFKDIINYRNYNSYDIELFEEEDAYSDDEIELEEEGLIHESYNKTCNPLVQYLTSLIILKQKDLNWKATLIRFIELRCKYLKDICNQAITENDFQKINFFKVFKFIENTCDYTAKYFLSTESLIIKNLERYANSWKGTDLIKYDEWFIQDMVSFNVTSYIFDSTDMTESLIDSKLVELVNILSGFVRELIKPKFQESLDTVSNSLLVFHNFLFCLHKLHTTCVSNEKDSVLIKFVRERHENNLLTILLSEILEEIEIAYSSHLDNLMVLDSSLLMTIESRIFSSDYKLTSDKTTLFTNDLVGIMNHDLDEYIKVMTKLSFHNSDEEINIMINKWFEKINQFIALTDINEEFNSNQLDPFNCLNHLCKVLSNSNNDYELKVSGFSRDRMLKKFSDLTRKLISKSLTELEDFTARISKLKSEISTGELEPLYYMLRILLNIKDRVLTLNQFTIKSQNLLNLIDELVSSIYKDSIKAVSEKDFNSSFDKFLDESIFESNTCYEDIPLRPSLKLSSMLYHLCNEFLNVESKFSGYKFGALFSNEVSSSIFAELKNEWILKELIEGKIMKVLDNCFKEINRSEINHKEMENKEKGTNKFEHSTENKNLYISDCNPREAQNARSVESKEPSCVSATEEIDNVVRNGLSRDKILFVFANIVYLLQFTSSIPITDLQNSKIKIFYERIKNLNTKGGLDEAVSKLIVKGVSEYFKSNKGIFLPLSI